MRPEPCGHNRVSRTQATDQRNAVRSPVRESNRYPHLDLIEKRVELDKIPSCPCCQKEMKDSGLTEDSEYLTVIPKRYYVIQQKRVKYRCSTCQDQLITTPAIPRLKSGSSYSDEMIIDVALSKYCDLIPVERYVQMAARGGVKDLPANTLIPPKFFTRMRLPIACWRGTRSRIGTCGGSRQRARAILRRMTRGRDR